MSQAVRTEVERLLAQADERVRRAEQLHQDGSEAQKVEAAGQLTWLRRQRDELKARLAEVDQPDGGGSRVLQWVKEDWMLLLQRLDAFIDGR
ncbi:MAG TPA: hypothetical protein VMU59_02390 [Caulobacteraceae bacterium]|nr:hypothetical protein [Caulobacteraceae bacterium]